MHQQTPTGEKISKFAPSVEPERFGQSATKEQFGAKLASSEP
jgi:hypothetical protein